MNLKKELHRSLWVDTSGGFGQLRFAELHDQYRQPYRAAAKHLCNITGA